MCQPTLVFDIPPSHPSMLTHTLPYKYFCLHLHCSHKFTYLTVFWKNHALCHPMHPSDLGSITYVPSEANAGIPHKKNTFEFAYNLFV